MSKFKLFFLIAIAVIGGVVAVIAVFGLMPKPPAPVELEWWGVFDDSDTFKDLIENYKKANPYVKQIRYKKIPYADYEQELVNALAEGRGPDIFSIQNTWLPRYFGKISPLLQGEDTMTFRQFDESFVDVAKSDLTKDGQIYGIPFFVDTLALYYNKNIFNSEKIALPPKTWEEFQETVRILVKKDERGAITRAGASIGTAKNINRAPDILSLIMLQAGAKMIDFENKKAVFDQPVQDSEGEMYYAGEQALKFYTHFADPKMAEYTWNLSSGTHYSVDAFSEQRAAMMINYSYIMETVRAKAPRLDFDVTYIPQPSSSSKSVNYANYWAQAVSSNISKAKAEEAWKFLIFASQKENLKTYLTKTHRPTSRKDLVGWQKSDPDIGIFAEQALSAFSWYQPDSEAVESIFNEMIDSVYLGQRSVEEAIEWGVEQVTLLIR